MNGAIEEFIHTFNEYYPFERYVVKNPISINYLFDDVVLTEIFIPETEIEPIIHNGVLISHTKINGNEIYVKLRHNEVEFRLGLFDLSDGCIETIINIVYKDFGDYLWEKLFTDYENEENYCDLVDVLNGQKSIIKDKYLVCNIKKNFKIDKIIKLIK